MKAMTEMGKYKGDFTQARSLVFGTKEQTGFAKGQKMFSPINVVNKNVIKEVTPKKTTTSVITGKGVGRTNRRYGFERKV